MAEQVFAWRSGNALRLLIDGQRFFPHMLERIAAAQRQVELELYLVESGACATLLVEALCAAAGRGVAVRCLFDAFGTQTLPQAQRRQLHQAGVQLHWFNPVRWKQGLRNFHRDHRKLLLVDGQFAFVGGTGASDEFWDPEADLSRWHEVMVEISGPLVADWQQLFERQWLAAQARLAWRLRMPEVFKRPAALPPAEPGLGRVAFADALQHRDILRSLVRALNGAQQRIWLATPYFLPTWRVRRALRKAASRGVEVRLLLSGRHIDHPPVRYAGQRYYPRLLRAGVQIFEYQPRFLHLKMVLVDAWVSVGSCNFDHWNLRFNLDANLEALDPDFNRAVAACFTADFEESTEVTLADWRARPLLRRIQQRLWGWLDRLTVNLLDRRR